jgi:hypothetical protein
MRQIGCDRVGRQIEQRAAQDLARVMTAGAIGAAAGIDLDIAAEMGERQVGKHPQPGRRAATRPAGVEFGDAGALIASDVAPHLDIPDDRRDMRAPGAVDGDELAEDEVTVADADQAKGAGVKIDLLMERSKSSQLTRAIYPSTG